MFAQTAVLHIHIDYNKWHCAMADQFTHPLLNCGETDRLVLHHSQDRQPYQRFSNSVWYSYSNQLECGPMPNVMAVLPNTGGALCSTPQSLAD